MSSVGTPCAEVAAEGGFGADDGIGAPGDGELGDGELGEGDDEGGPPPVGATLRATIAWLGARAPLILHIDDVQWADGDSGSLMTRFPIARCSGTRFSKLGYGSLWMLTAIRN